MRKSYYIFISLCALNTFRLYASLISGDETVKEDSAEEALFVRRILEFWRDKESSIVKSQIEQFLTQYPHSEYRDSLLVILGDTFWNEKDYVSALKNYRRISKADYQEKVYNNCLDCYYKLGHFQEVKESLESKVKDDQFGTGQEQETLWVYYLAEAYLNLAKKNPNALDSSQQLNLAKKYFRQIQNSEHKINAKLALAEIESLQGNAEIVVQYYLELANDISEKREEMLWRAAQQKAQYDPETALIELAEIQNSYGGFASNAALTRLNTLFDLKRYQQIIDEKSQFFKALKTSQHPILYLFIGRSYFYLNQFEQALTQLQLLHQPEFNSFINDPHIEKSMLIMMALSGNHLHKLELVSGLRKQFQNQFSQDPALAEMLYYEAMTLAYYQKYADALQNFENILSQFPSYEHNDNVIYEKSVINLKLGKWLDSRAGFEDIIAKSSNSNLIRSSLEHLPYLSMQLLEVSESSEAANSNKWRLILLEDLKNILKPSVTLDESQRAKYTLQLGRVQYDLQQYKEAISSLLDYIKKYSADENLFQAHLLLALCYQEGMQDPIHFAHHAEIVLKLKPDFADKDSLHMNLFNAYLEMAKNLPSSESYYNQAAEHLFIALKNRKESIKLDNQLWLANFYYNKIRTVSQDYEIEPLLNEELANWAKRGLLTYQIALPNIEEVVFQNDNLFLETEYFKMSNLYGWLLSIQDQKKILSHLIRMQLEAPNLNWKWRSRILYAYANVNLSIGEREEALQTYRQLFFPINIRIDPYMVNAAKLKGSRLAFEFLPESKRHLQNEEMIAILKMLKDVQIHKLLSQEPLHLEAALDYVEMRSSIEPLNKRDEQKLFLLNRVKEDFTARDDLWSREYAEAREQNPEKNLIVESYLSLIEAHINQLEAKLAEKENRPSENKSEMARSLYQKLLADKDNIVSKYVQNQAEYGLQQLK